MGVQLNIEGMETFPLAHAVAETAGQPASKAICQARARQTEGGGETRLAALHTIVRDAPSRGRPRFLDANIADLAYDASGAPK